MGKLASAPGSLARHSVHAREAKPSIPVPSTPARRRRFAPLAAMAASTALAVGVSSAWIGDPVTFLRADHRTAIAKTGSFTLSDGSRVDLGPSSAIAVNYGDTERRVELLSGVAYFTAVPKARAGGRPFVVEASNGASQALGTRFQVDRSGSNVAVTVMEHDVAVSAADRAGRSRRVVLLPGQRVSYDAAGGLGEMQPIKPELALAWQQGRLVFDREPLAQVLAELNRYRAGRILVLGDRLAAEKVSGVFDAHDIDGALAALANEVGASRVNGPLLTVLY
jgi:transmembrane sensor